MEQNYALVDSNNNIVNVVVFDDSILEENKNIIIQSNDAVFAVLIEDPRYNYINGHYENGAIWTPKPYSSFIQDFEHNVWVPPIPYPDDNKEYVWNEEILNWEEIQVSE